MTITERIRNAHLAVIIGTVAASVVLALALSSPAQAHENHCFEDMSCWHTPTMGNRIGGERDSWERDGGPNLAGAHTEFVLVKWAGNGVRTV